MNRPLRVLILGYYGYANAGDEIVLAGIYNGIAQSSEGRPFELRVLSGFPSHTTEMHGCKAYPRFSPSAVLSALWWADCLVLGGGSLIQDVTSRRSAAYYLWIIRLALSLRCRVFLWAQGFGPLEDPKLRSSAAKLLSKSSMITLRDPLSLNDLRGLDIPDEKLMLSADPAFLVPPAHPETGSIFELEAQEKGYFGIALRSWPSLERAVDEVSSACRSFAEDSGLASMYIPFQQPQDNEIANKVASASGMNYSLLSARPGPNQMVRVFEQLKMVLGMRLHSVILAAKAAVPFVGLSYDPKIERFCQAAEMPCLTVAQLHRGEVLDMLHTVYSNHDGMSERLREFNASQTELARKSAMLFWQCMAP